jgi:SAM-dependent methyltransferase
MNEVKAWWEETAEWFQQDANLDVALNWTGFGEGGLDLLDDVAGERVLELGCGGGQCTVALAQRGGDVAGIDLSGAQLAHARDLVADHGVDPALVQGDVTDLPFAAGSFDIACNAYVFQWVGDLEACFEETHRVLRPRSRFVFSMPHSVYGLADPETGDVVASYFDTGRQVSEEPDLEHDMVTFRHRVSDVHNALVDAGFTVERLHEPGSPDPDDYEEGPWGERRPELLSKLPATLVVEARRN